MRKESCPAWGKVCTSCGEKNHFPASRKCKGRSVHVVRDDYASDSSTSITGTISTITVELCHDVNSAHSQHPLIYCEMLINDKPVRLQFDCGATVRILPKRYFKNLEVRPEIVNLKIWNKSSVKALGRWKAHVKNPVTNEKFKVDFVIVNEAFTPLLSGNAAQAMGLITVTPVAQLIEHRSVTREVVSSTPVGPTLRVLKYLSRKCCFCNYISKWLDFQVFSDKDYKP